MANECYACEEPATTVEHVPPRSFFPTGKRDQLITVPSCTRHNNELSKDVEYVRNVIPMLIGTNDVGNEHFSGKVMRSFDRSTPLMIQTFRTMQTVSLGDGTYTGMFTLEMDRLDRVFKAIVCALHYRDTGQRISSWAVISPTLYHQPGVSLEQRTTWEHMLGIFASVPLSARSSANPKVFSYASGSTPTALVETAWFYKLVFYEAFIVQAFRLPEGYVNAAFT